MADKECIACAEKIRVNAKLCKHCGTRQDDPSFLPETFGSAEERRYPTEADGMPETYQKCADALKAVLIDLGLSIEDCEPRTSPHGKKVIFISTNQAVDVLGFGNGERWIHLDPSADDEVVIDDGISDIGPAVPPRALAISVLMRLKYFMMNKAAHFGVSNQIMKKLGLPESSNFALGTDYQADLFEITRAEAWAKLPEYWVGLDDNPASDEEATFLAALATAGFTELEKTIEDELEPSKLVPKVMDEILGKLPKGVLKKLRK